MGKATTTKLEPGGEDPTGIHAYCYEQSTKERAAFQRIVSVLKEAGQAVPGKQVITGLVNEGFSEEAVVGAIARAVAYGDLHLDGGQQLSVDKRAAKVEVSSGVADCSDSCESTEAPLDGAPCDECEASTGEV